MAGLGEPIITVAQDRSRIIKEGIAPVALSGAETAHVAQNQVEWLHPILTDFAVLLRGHVEALQDPFAGEQTKGRGELADQLSMPMETHGFLRFIAMIL